ncbi:helix-turn-helix transcriptional regulator [Methyloferula stellata]|uniref:helix-turn-helix transcriptional regulator n=1 Tax=Methyloferula stellata TaxID=876270 RepID=UPI00035EE5BA|nr:helix-turn-helix transcriptional regulator [Methyloferula stellata]
MTEYLTTRELAAMLRVKERKVYDLVATGTLPVHRVTGKLLFPKLEIEEWIVTNGAAAKPDQSQRSKQVSPEAAVIIGGHDPLLEWALRASHSGIASFMDGAVDGLQRWSDHHYLAVGLHIPEPGGGWNVASVSGEYGDQPVVLIEWAKRKRGLIYRADLHRAIDSFKAIGKLRFQSRQAESGSELVLARLLEREGLKRTALNCVDAVERSEMDLAMAIAAGKADVGLGIEASARQFQLEFKELIEERFDLLIWRKAYFDPAFQKLIRFCAGDAFKTRARELGGYDIAGLGTVHFNGP